MFVDLHNHSLYSDGSMSPQEIVKAAKEAFVSILAITDHDVLEGSKELLRIGEKEGLHVISGVEVNAIEGKDNIHVLGYGVNLEDEIFNRRIKGNREKLDQISIILIDKLKAVGYNVSVEEFHRASYSMSYGGWKALYYFLEKGITDSLTDGFRLYDEYQCGYDIVDFPSVAEVVNWIHEANGIAILAHPGVSLLKPDMTNEEFYATLSQFLSYGLDGIECYYPKHSNMVTETCVRVCKERGLYITTGSDCHGAFQKSKIGELGVKLELLRLPEDYFNKH